jgi:hypothetical protein
MSERDTGTFEAEQPHLAIQLGVSADQVDSPRFEQRARHHLTLGYRR